MLQECFGCATNELSGAAMTLNLCPACVGVTGSRVSMESRVEGLISMLHDVTDKSVAVGFGISAPDAVCSALMSGCAVLLFQAGITIFSAITLTAKLNKLHTECTLTAEHTSSALPIFDVSALDRH